MHSNIVDISCSHTMIIIFSRNFSFNDAHCEGARVIAQAAREAGVKRLIHVSALNANEESPSKFLQSKVLISFNLLFRHNIRNMCIINICDPDFFRAYRKRPWHLIDFEILIENCFSFPCTKKESFFSCTLSVGRKNVRRLQYLIDK